MLVYLAAAATALVYALNIPVRIAMALDLGAENRIKIGVGVFYTTRIYTATIRLDRAFLAQVARTWRARQKTSKNIDWMAVIRRVLSSVELLRGRLVLILGTGDAASTALLCGVVEAAAQAAIAPIPRIRPEIRVAPDFQRAHLLLSGGGILSLRLGHIIRTGIWLGTKTLFGRMHHGTPSN